MTCYYLLQDLIYLMQTVLYALFHTYIHTEHYLLSSNAKRHQQIGTKMKLEDKQRAGLESGMYINVY